MCHKLRLLQRSLSISLGLGLGLGLSLSLSLTSIVVITIHKLKCIFTIVNYAFSSITRLQLDGCHSDLCHSAKCLADHLPSAPEVKITLQKVV
jgi:hypothetical protein